MKNTAKHIIYNQTLEVRFNDFAAAHLWDADNQVRTAEAMYKSMERCFETCDPVKEYLTIDRIELDLGAFSSGQFLSEMPEKLYLELYKILSSFHNDLLDFEEAEIVEDISSKNSWSGADNNKVGPIIMNSELRAFLFFLQQGHLPWWYSGEPDWNPEWVQKLSGKKLQELQNYLKVYDGDEVSYERALVRLISQFSDTFLINLLRELQLKEPVEKAWSWFIHFCKALQKAETDSYLNVSPLPPFSDLRLHFWKMWIGYATGRSAIPELVTIIALFKQPSSISILLSEIATKNEWIDSLPEFWHGEFVSLTQKGLKNKPDLGISREFTDHTKIEKLNATLTESHTGKTGYTDKQSSIDKAIVTNKTSCSEKESYIDKVSYTGIENFTYRPTYTGRKNYTDKSNQSIREDFILIPDSGLVLLHPFLQRLFDHCHWLNGNEFVNDEARNRAVYLLHYLAAGNEDAPEYVLMLPKLLCGFLPECPIEPPLLLTKTEKAACNEMLTELIAHWTALQNTSPAGLREAFLMREGRLFSKNEGWHIKVLAKTEDILLNRLPWGFSMIKLPWMPCLLTVSWE